MPASSTSKSLFPRLLTGTLNNHVVIDNANEWLSKRFFIRFDVPQVEVWHKKHEYGIPTAASQWFTDGSSFGIQIPDLPTNLKSRVILCIEGAAQQNSIT